MKTANAAAGTFRPPYCPNTQCRWHQPALARSEAKFYGHGILKNKRDAIALPRFRCTRCSRVFSASFFFITYRDRGADNYGEIMELRMGCFTKRRIAKKLGCAPDTVARKLTKISRWANLRMCADQDRIRIKESIAYDGIENFSFSQYDINNINHAVGRESLYVYDFNFSPLNRKGRMSRGQKERKKKMESSCGKYPFRSIESSSRRIFERLLKNTDGPLVLHTDAHLFYRRAINRIAENSRIAHFVTPGKNTRNYKNPLFAINHMDMLTRHQLADFKRETIAFAKTSQSMIESFTLLVAYKNYMAPKFSKRQKRDPASNYTSPAMHIGLADKIFSLKEFLGIRITKAQVRMNEDWEAFFHRTDPLSRRPIRAYTGC